MRDMSDRLASGPADTRPVPRRFLVLYLVFMISGLVIWPMLGRRAVPSYNVRSYESSSRIAGLPIFASGAAPVAIIAIGGVSLGFIALGGLAIGWRALGGGAIGYRAFGGLAIGGYAYAGNGVAFGYHEAGGRQKEKLLG